MSGEWDKAASAQQPFLDFLRAAAALLVVFSHARNWFFLGIGSVDHPSIAHKLFFFGTTLGNEAVAVFFVLSGLLVGGSVRKAMLEGSFKWSDYLVARFARIYIVYLPALILTGAVFGIGLTFLNDPGDNFRRPIFSELQWSFGGAHGALCHLAGLQGMACPSWRQNPPLWSLGFEWSLYLFAPLLIALALSRAALAARIAAAVVVLAVVGAMADDLARCTFWCSMWFLGVGSHWFLWTRRVPLAVGLVGCAGVVAGLVLVAVHRDYELAAQALVAIGIAVALSCRALVTIQWSPRFFKWSAGFSYSLYATHVPIVYLMVMVLQALGVPEQKLAADDPQAYLAYLGFALTVLTALVVGYVFSLGTERQTKRLRRLLSRRSDAAAAAHAGARPQAGADAPHAAARVTPMV